ncbi:MAG TPA: GNAT family protein [Pseudogracilibacillus sp.]|nr:GNAT family protein [Pseudogracilibacillus sp.]
MALFTYKVNDEIVLALLQERHAEQLFALIDASRESLERWLPWVKSTHQVDDSATFIKQSLQQFANNDGFQAGIWYKGQLAGIVGLHAIDSFHRSTTIGYWLGKQYEGKGIMTRACRAVVRHCFDTLKLQRVEIHVAVGNKKSKAIPERLGFKYEGKLRNAEFLKDQFVDVLLYSLTKI